MRNTTHDSASTFMEVRFREGRRTGLPHCTRIVPDRRANATEYLAVPKRNGTRPNDADRVAALLHLLRSALPIEDVPRLAGALAFTSLRLSCRAHVSARLAAARDFLFRCADRCLLLF